MDLSIYAVSYGKFGQCDICKGAPEETASIRGKRYCRGCKLKTHPKSSAEFQDSDATFRCREIACDAINLSYRECLVGSCCESALNNDPRNEYCSLSEDEDLHEEHQLIHEIFDRVREEKNDAVEKIDDAKDQLNDAKEEVANLERDLAKARKEVENAEKEIQLAEENENAVERFLGKVKKRVLIVTKAAIGASDEPAAKKKKPNEENEKLQCKVCFYSFDEEHPEAVIIPCGHKACYNCISNLPQKKCPSCRAQFTVNNVYKVFN